MKAIYATIGRCLLKARAMVNAPPLGNWKDNATEAHNDWYNIESEPLKTRPSTTQGRVVVVVHWPLIRQSSLGPSVWASRHPSAYYPLSRA